MHRRHLLFGLPPWLLAPRAWAKPWEIRIVTGEVSGQTPIIDALRRVFPELTDNEGSKGSRGIALAIGPMGLQQALSLEAGEQIISLFNSGPSYQNLTASLSTEIRQRVTAIYAEPSPAQQMSLIHKLFGRRVVVGVLLGKATAYLEPLIRRVAGTAGLDVSVAHHAQASIARSLLQLSGADVLLAVPDREIYNANSLRDVLESTYRRSMPMVGYSTGLVNAGALASAYASLEDVISHARELVDMMMVTGQLPDPQYPRYWRVAVNDNVARSLNLVLDNSARLLGNRHVGDSR